MIKKKKLLRLRPLYVSITALLFSINFLGLAGDLSGQAFAQLPGPVPFTATDLAGLQTELEDLERNGELWGVVLIADGTDVVLHEAFGFADRNRDVANSTGTAFNIASIGKQLTATAVLQLAQRGRLDLDDSIGRWIDGLPGSTGATGCFVHEPAKGRAVPYTENDTGHLVTAYPLMAYRCSPAGGAYSTSEDLLRFQLAATGGQLLDEHHTTLLLNRFAEGVDKAAAFEFIGGTEGANAWAETSLETGRTVVVLANLDPPAAEAVALGLLEWLREHPLD